jgi:hypothetical protein
MGTWYRSVYMYRHVCVFDAGAYIYTGIFARIVSIVCVPGAGVYIYTGMYGFWCRKIFIYRYTRSLVPACVGSWYRYVYKCRHVCIWCRYVYRYRYTRLLLPVPGLVVVGEY